MALTIQTDIPLAEMTTIGIGGPARFFADATTVDDVIEAVRHAAGQSLPLFVLGGGSNLLIADAGFDGLVLRNSLRGIVEENDDRFVLVKAAAGEPWDAFVEYCVKRGLAGVECLSGIPGSVGATPIQNVGAYGQEVSQTIVRLEALEIATLRTRWFTAEECQFAYRESVFKSELCGRFIILSVTFRLERDAAATIRYPELKRELDAAGVAPSDLDGVRRAVIAIRKRKGMVLDPSDPDSRSDGSFFTNPLLSPEEFERFQSKAAAAGLEEFPSFPAADDSVKLSAAWLIEHAGFSRGYGSGRAGLSSKHTLAIINRGGATAGDILRLVEEIVSAVESKFGVTLVPEPNFIGF